MSEDAIYFGPMRGHQFRSFSNFAFFVVIIDGKEYRSVEHFFQASKAMNESDHEFIRSADSPQEAKKRGRELAHLRPDWEAVKIDIMRKGLFAKFRQHESLRELLISTGDLAIHEDARYDKEWGWFGGTGKDLLGRLLMEVRELLRRELAT